MSLMERYSIPFQFFFTVNHSQIQHVSHLYPPTNYMLSLYTIWHRNRLHSKVLDENRDKIDCLFFDSGGISAWNKKNIQWLSWENQNHLVELSSKFQPNIISQMDLPMYPEALRLNRFSPSQALKQTIQNAEKFLDAKTDAIKCFNIQGWTLDQYIECIEAYDDLGIFSNDNWIGIGSTCIRKPPDLYTVYRHVTEKVFKLNPQQHIHAFGISTPTWLYNLAQYGVLSGDSSAPVFNVVRREVLLGDGTRINVRLRPLPVEVERVLTLFNFWMYFIRLYKQFNKNEDITTLLNFNQIQHEIEKDKPELNERAVLNELMSIKDTAYQEIREKVQTLETIIDGATQQKVINRQKLKNALSLIRSIQTKYFPQVNYSLYYFRSGHGVGNQPLNRTNFKKWKRLKNIKRLKKLETFNKKEIEK